MPPELSRMVNAEVNASRKVEERVRRQVLLTRACAMPQHLQGLDRRA